MRKKPNKSLIATLLVMGSHQISPRGIFRTKKTETTPSLIRGFKLKMEKVSTLLRLAREQQQTLLSVMQGLKAPLKVERRVRARSQKETASCSD